MNNEITSGRCYPSRFKSIDSIVLENAFLRLEWLPNYGAKLASMKVKKMNQQHELLYQEKKETLQVPNYGATFSDYDMSGFDECFPTIDECQITQQSGSREHTNTIPDHGEVWSLPWQVLKLDETTIECKVISEKFGYILTKRIHLVQNKLLSRYKVELDPSYPKLPFIWTPHALFQIKEESQLIIPNHMNKIINVCSGGKLGSSGLTYDYPIAYLNATKSLDLSRFESIEANNCEKYYYVDKLKADDLFGFENNVARVLMHVDSEKVPYLGIWKNQGGCFDDYNFALEPCTGIYDSTQSAMENDHCAYVLPGEIYEWKFRMEIESI